MRNLLIQETKEWSKCKANKNPFPKKNQLKKDDCDKQDKTQGSWHSAGMDKMTQDSNITSISMIKLKMQCAKNHILIIN